MFMILINITNNNHQDVHLHVNDDRGGFAMQSGFVFVFVLVFVSLFIFVFVFSL